MLTLESVPNVSEGRDRAGVDAIGAALDSLGNMSREELREARAAKFLAIGRKI